MGDFLLGTPRWVHLAHLASAREQRGTAYSDAAARVSLLLDLDQGAVRTKSDYARIWRWQFRHKGRDRSETMAAARKRVRREWPAIVNDVVQWATSNGAQVVTSPLTARIPEAWWEHVDRSEWPERMGAASGRAPTSPRPSSDRENGGSEQQSRSSDHLPTTPRSPSDQHTNLPFLPDFHKEREGALARDGDSDAPKPDAEAIPYAEIVEDLNARTDSRYKPRSEATRKLIRARWAEGHRLPDFRRVHAVKAAEWKGTERARYLRPQTLYGTKFEAYLNQPERSRGPSRPERRDARNDPRGTFQRFYDA